MSEGKIKTALEKALERSEKFRQVSTEELKLMEYKPRGNSLAGSFLIKNTDLAAELAQVPDDIRSYVKQGIEETLLKNITLPENENAKQLSKKALAGFTYIKEDLEGLNHIIGELEYLFNYYQQAAEQAKATVRAQLHQQFMAAKQQLEAQYGGAVEINLENQPEFQNELRKVMSSLNQRFEGALQQAKAKIAALK
ncbi:ElaB/YqjD/DUF883 family membrane-anchored ribosome-binding protein [Desulfohalotomaculum tongense]|uniref:hypothetical protein n=1 Tax=Desulforadius tongensis TaxID=1216062 RepID=UPI001959EB1E|nr:hypothetical protein [Desulforadius tongensis]MBM7855642.1 ElaB/YqjD/DUF883 family membrane-anchored ribosome-binding protein [Desulforadius tongensis]